jgi:CHAD domain-containing protein
MENPGDILHPGIQPEDSLAEAGKKIWRHQLAQMLSHEAGARSGEDIEALHDMRVSTRRMRAAFDVFGDAFKQKALSSHLDGLRATGRTLGKVRDLDVLLEKAAIYIQTLPEEEQHGLDPLVEAWHVRREAARLELLDFLNGEVYTQFKEGFADFLSPQNTERGIRAAGSGSHQTTSIEPTRVKELAPVLIYQRLASVRAYDSILDTATLAQLHQLRIQFKRLRYTVEYFQEVLNPEVEKVIDDLKRIQDHLGNLNDANVAVNLLKEFFKEFSARQDRHPAYLHQNSAGIMMYLTYRYNELHQLILAFPDTWQWFNRPALSRNLALAVSKL